MTLADDILKLNKERRDVTACLLCERGYVEATLMTIMNYRVIGKTPDEEIGAEVLYMTPQGITMTVVPLRTLWIMEENHE